MYEVTRTAGTVLRLMALALLLIGGKAAAQAVVNESVEISDHYVFNTSTKAPGATILIRDFQNRKVTATVATSALEPGWAYSIWWAIFNRPQFCQVPTACTTADLEINGGDPRVAASVFWGGGLVADDGGHASTSLELLPGQTSRELFASSANYGLRSLTNAQIHLVLRSHGMAGEWGSYAQQLGTASQACPPTGCANVFASFHPPLE